jgi:hypothetical protein
MTLMARGLSPCRSIPADRHSILALWISRQNPSAIWLRQEFPVQRKRTRVLALTLKLPIPDLLCGNHHPESIDMSGRLVELRTLALKGISSLSLCFPILGPVQAIWLDSWMLRLQGRQSRLQRRRYHPPLRQPGVIQRVNRSRILCRTTSPSTMKITSSAIFVARSAILSRYRDVDNRDIALSTTVASFSISDCNATYI